MPRIRPLDPAIPQIDSVETERNVENDTESTSFLSDAEILDISKSAKSNFYCIFQKFPNLIYFMQNFTFPGVTAKVIDIPRPQHADKLPVFAHSLSFDDLTLNFMMDENFLTYFNMYKWIFENEYKFYDEDAYTRMMLVILNNAKMPIIKAEFSSIVPASISSIDFEHQTADIITWNCTLKYYSFRITYLDNRMIIPWQFPDKRWPDNPVLSYPPGHHKDF